MGWDGVKEVNNCDDGKWMDLVPIIKYQTPPNTLEGTGNSEVSRNSLYLPSLARAKVWSAEQGPFLLYDDN